MSACGLIVLPEAVSPNPTRLSRNKVGVLADETFDLQPASEYFTRLLRLTFDRCLH